MAKLPAAIGPYSIYRKVGDMIYTSGQIPINPETNQVDGKTIEEQTYQVLNNLKAIMETEGLSMKNIVKTTVYLDNMDDFAVCNKIYSEFFEEPYPSRTAIEVAKLPMGVLVEIEAIVSLKV